MKKLFLILIASFALVMAHDFNRVYAGDNGDGGGGIPLSQLAGKYAGTAQGSITLCFKPDFSASESCSAAGAVPVAFNVSQVSSESGKAGISCFTSTTTLSVPGDVHPTTGSVSHAVAKVTSYDPATGSGDASFTEYSGGKCIGSKFDSTGATVADTGTEHFVASGQGNRIDFVATAFTSAIGDIGAFNVSGLSLKQKE
jgi:hypothetical protein